MKTKLFLCFAFFACISFSYGQAPNKIKYQAVARDSSGNYVANQAVSLKISILKDNQNGFVSYAETHNSVTSSIGIINLEIGTGMVIEGQFDTINWGSGSYFAKTEIDIAGGSNYTLAGTTQLVSVPYALYANQSANNLLPVFTQEQINGLNPAAGYTIFNSSSDQLQIWNGMAWIVFSGACLPLPTTANAGPDQTVMGNTTVLEGNQPVTGTGQWSILSGEGGVLGQVDNPASSITGIAGTTYMLAWTISSYCGASVDTVMISLAELLGAPCPGTPSVLYEGKTYNTVQIGSQCWFKENLDVGTHINVNVVSSDNGQIEKYCYNNDMSLCNTYGGLYDWDEMMNYTMLEGAQGICPAGWHIPTNNDFCVLLTFLEPTIVCSSVGYIGQDVGGKMKETGTSFWNAPNTGATNESGFTGLGTGYWSNYTGSGSFYSFKVSYGLWTSSSISPVLKWEYYLANTSSRIYHQQLSTNYYVSVRCLKND